MGCRRGPNCALFFYIPNWRKMADKNISVPAQSGGKIFLVPGGGSRTLFWGGKFSPDECQCKFLIRPQIFFSCFGFRKWRQTGDRRALNSSTTKDPGVCPWSATWCAAVRCSQLVIAQHPRSHVAGWWTRMWLGRGPAHS